MITKFLTDVTTKFNPFTKRAKTCRSFLAHLPPNARQTMKIKTTILPRDSQEPSSIYVKFSTFNVNTLLGYSADRCTTEDGKELHLDTEKLGIKDVMEEINRHSRGLNRQADLLGN
jgi:large subunit ribosomal protein L53